MGDTQAPQQKMEAARRGGSRCRAPGEVVRVLQRRRRCRSRSRTLGTRPARRTNGQEPASSIVVNPPQITTIGHRIQQYAPVKIGYLVDIDAGMLLGDCLDAVVLACEDALNDGELKRPIEIVPMVARGLPREEAAHRSRRLRGVVRRRVPRGARARTSPTTRWRCCPRWSVARSRSSRPTAPSPSTATTGSRSATAACPRRAPSAPGGCARRASSGSPRSRRSRPAATSTRRPSAPRRSATGSTSSPTCSSTRPATTSPTHCSHLHDEVQPDAIAYLGLRLPGRDVQSRSCASSTGIRLGS